MLQLISNKFKFALRKTSLKKELLGGLVTFCSMSYILPINSSILNDGGNGVPYGGVFIASALIGFIGSLIIGLFSNMPIGIAPGMGSNVFFVSTIMHQFNMDWKIAMSIVFLNGLIFVFFSIIGFTEKFVKTIPSSLKYAIIFGLGLFITYVGLKNSGLLIIENYNLKFGNLKNITVILTIIGTMFLFILTIKKIKLAIVYFLLSITIIGMIIGQIMPNHTSKGLNAFTDIEFNYFQLVEFKNVFGYGILKIPLALQNIKTYLALLALIFMSLCSASGTILSIKNSANINTTNSNKNYEKKALICIGISSSLAGVLGTSSSGAFLESNAGVSSGAKTGVSSIFVGILFLLIIPLFPILQILFKPSFIVAPVLILIGWMMAKNVQKIDWTDMATSLSSFILIVIMIFTASIINGIAFGIIFYIFLNIVTQKWDRLNINLIVFGILFALYIIIMGIML